MKKIITSILAILILSGCASSDADKKQHQLELMASNRAGVLSSGLPIESGPLKIMRVLAHKNVVEMMMIYNQDAQNAKPLSLLMRQSVASYCNTPAIRQQIDAGLIYRLKIRNARGQLMTDKIVSSEVCQPPKKK